MEMGMSTTRGRTRSSARVARSPDRPKGDEKDRECGEQIQRYVEGAFGIDFDRRRNCYHGGKHLRPDRTDGGEREQDRYSRRERRDELAKLQRPSPHHGVNERNKREGGTGLLAQRGTKKKCDGSKRKEQ